jgi:hypothetical protein
MSDNKGQRGRRVCDKTMLRIVMVNSLFDEAFPHADMATIMRQESGLLAQR